MRKHLAELLVLACLLQATAVSAAPTHPAAAAESPWRIGIALGYGQRSNPLVQSDDITIVVDLDIAWFGERWFFDNGDLGLTLLDNQAITINAVARLNSDRVFFGKTDTQFISIGDVSSAPLVTEKVEVPDRDYAIEAGVELLADGDWGHLQFAIHHDVSGTHEGFEVFANLARGFRNGRWYVEPSAGFSYKSEHLNDYYWGVRENESNSVLPRYEAAAGVNARARLLASYQLNRRWAVFAVAEYERINPDAADSPLVEDQQVFGGFTGFKYGF